MFNKAKEVLEEYISNYSDDALIRRELAQGYIDQGKLDLALVELDRAFILDPTHHENILLKGDIFYLKGDFTKAREEYQKLLKVTEPLGRWQGLLSLPQRFQLMQAKTKELKSNLNKNEHRETPQIIKRK